MRLPSGRRRRSGAVRANEPGDVLRCLLLARGPEWVAVDVATRRRRAQPGLRLAGGTDRLEPLAAPRLEQG